MSNKSKNKGDNDERMLVNLLREHGLECERTLESGARSDGSETWDINLFVPFGNRSKKYKVECKCRESMGNWLWDYKGDADVLSIRKNRKPRLLVMSEDKFIELLKK